MVIVRQAAWLSALVLAAIVLLALSPLPQATRLEEAISGAVAPIAAALRTATRPMTDVLLHAGQLERLAAENADLRRLLTRNETDLATIREERTAAQQAAALVAAVGDRAEQFVTASVLARDPAPGRRLLLINRGTAQGVRPGQPVLGAGATLVGIVAQVDEGHARIRLLTDRNSSISSTIQSSRTPAALTGNGESLRLDFVPHGAAVAPGDVVLTSAIGGLLPPGLLVGKVTRVHSAPQDLNETIDVEPLADLSRLEEVLVMTGFTPGATLPLSSGADSASSGASSKRAP